MDNPQRLSEKEIIIFEVMKVHPAAKVMHKVF